MVSSMKRFRSVLVLKIQMHTVSLLWYIAFNLTDFLWNLHFDTDHAESLSLSTVKLMELEVTAILRLRVGVASK